MEAESKEGNKHSSLLLKLENVKDRLVYAGLLGESFLQEKAAVESEIKQAQNAMKENCTNHDHEKVNEIRTQLQDLENSLIDEESKLVQLLNSKSYSISSSKSNNDKLIQNAFPYDQPTRAETYTQYATTVGQNLLQQLKTLHFRFKEKDADSQKILKEKEDLKSQLDSLNDEFKAYAIEKSSMRAEYQVLEQRSQILSEKLANSDSLMKMYMDEKEKLAAELSSLRLSFGQLQCLLSKTEDIQKYHEAETIKKDAPEVFLESNPNFQNTHNDTKSCPSPTSASYYSSTSSSLISSESSVVSDGVAKSNDIQEDTATQKRIDNEGNKALSKVMDQFKLPEKGSLLNLGLRNLEELSVKLRNSSAQGDECVHFLLTTRQLQQAVENNWSIKQIPGLSISHNLRFNIDETGNVEISKQNEQAKKVGVPPQQSKALFERTVKRPSTDVNTMNELNHKPSVKPLVPLLIISENDQKNRITAETHTDVRLNYPETPMSPKMEHLLTNIEKSQTREEVDNETIETIKSPVSFRFGDFDMESNRGSRVNEVSAEAQKPTIGFNRSAEDNGVELASTKSTASLLLHDTETYKNDYALKRRSSSFSNRYPITRRNLTLYESHVPKPEPQNFRLNASVPRRSLTEIKGKSIQGSIKSGRTAYLKTKPYKEYDWEQWNKVVSNTNAQRLPRSRSLILPRRRFSFTQSIPEVTRNYEEIPYSPISFEDTNQTRRKNSGMPSWFLKSSPAPSMFSLSEKGETPSVLPAKYEAFQKVESYQTKNKQATAKNGSQIPGKMGTVSVVPLHKGAKEQKKSLGFLQGMSEELAHVMIGDYIFKYKRNKVARFFTKPMHLRYAWIHPYQERLYWSKSHPFIGINRRTEVKSVKIIGFDIVTESYLENPDVVYNQSIIVLTDEKPMKIAARSGSIHEVWLKAFKDLKFRKIAAKPEFLREQPDFSHSDKPSNPSK
ncbi:cortical anchoring factor for dynein Mcp5/Num1 [Schizosaccharomyces cryophilus OY26]|uniref:Cortical anchoring factor for dynein Mcp5/Num1 n=1 Tax=Schizosaccharomyces cryophilus (strain OY26 / ATCC MYA-4695 / CBS 11777 / NBRC 106824 / NRRL Y48691) TaxID=653667 RepID=S9W6X2_SCHCR|nr:cortical anchoring factor for dynein Mcp5/Num1 [Schizosaccharomyces cryophilus OY26]EPY54284.1 cortical anchoring factor for dynein Mcp5/Num1 [Schizosaccharomyces cryophilus OY26]